MGCRPEGASQRRGGQMFMLVINGGPRARGLLTAMALVLSGCVTPPKLEPPLQTIAKEQLGLATQVAAPVVAKAWWSAFEDPQLDRLMQKALADNPSLAQAM